MIPGEEKDKIKMEGKDGKGEMAGGQRGESEDRGRS